MEPTTCWQVAAMSTVPPFTVYREHGDAGKSSSLRWSYPLKYAMRLLDTGFIRHCWTRPFMSGCWRDWVKERRFSPSSGGDSRLIQWAWIAYESALSSL